MVLFPKPKVVPLRINDPMGKITSAEDGVAGDQAPFENDAFEQPKGCLVLLGLVLAAARNGCLGQRQPRLVSHQTEQTHSVVFR